MKKIFKKIIFAAPLCLLPSFALAQTTSTITLPAGFVGDVLDQATALLSAMGGYLSLIVGVLLGMVVISFIISALHPR